MNATTGVLQFTDATVFNADHEITANGGTVEITNGTINGGRLRVADSNNSFVQFSGDVTLNDVTWEDMGAGQFRVDQDEWTRLLGDRLIPAGQTLVVYPRGRLNVGGGVLTNNGKIELPDCLSELHFESDTTLSGSGEVLLECPFLGWGLETIGITSVANVTLTLGSEQKIHGQGPVEVDLVNFGPIEADVAGKTLSLTKVRNEGTLGSVNGGRLHLGTGLANAGTLNLATGGTLSFKGEISLDRDLAASSGAKVEFTEATLANAGHTVSADGGIVEIVNSTINGGVLRVANGDNSNVQFSGDVTLNDVAWEDMGAGEFRVDQDAWTRLLGDRLIPAGQTLVVYPRGRLNVGGGTSTNNGKIELPDRLSELHFESDTTLSGSGAVVLDCPFLGWALKTIGITSAADVTLTVGPEQLYQLPSRGHFPTGATRCSASLLRRQRRWSVYAVGRVDGHQHRQFRCQRSHHRDYGRSDLWRGRVHQRQGNRWRFDRLSCRALHLYRRRGLVDEAHRGNANRRIRSLRSHLHRRCGHRRDR